MDEAPKEIWAYAFIGEKFHGKWHASDPAAYVGECPRYLRADLAAAQVAAAYKEAGKTAAQCCLELRLGPTSVYIPNAIRSLATDDQSDALEAVKREARNEGMREALAEAKAAVTFHAGSYEELGARDAMRRIEALIEKGPEK